MRERRIREGVRVLECWEEKEEEGESGGGGGWGG